MQLHRFSRLPCAGPPSRQVSSCKLPRNSRSASFCPPLSVVEQAVEASAATAVAVPVPAPSPAAPPTSSVASSTVPQTRFKRERPPGLSITVNDRSNVQALSAAILEHPAMQAVKVNSQDLLRLLCVTPEAVPRAVQAVAEANMQLIASQSPNRVQISSSVKRYSGLGLFDTLSNSPFKAFLFLSLVPKERMPAEAVGASEIRVSKTTVWSKVGRYLQAVFEEGATSSMMSCVGYNNLTNMYKAVMLARYNLVRGSTANSTQQTTTTTDAATPTDATSTNPEGSSSAGSKETDKPRVPRAPPTMDVAFVPTLRKQVIDSEKVLNVTTLHVFKCDPPAFSASPELRLATPRPSRATSPRPDRPPSRPGLPGDRPRRPASTSGSDDPVPARANNPPSRGRTPRGPVSDGNSVTVSAEEWQGMNQRLEAMAARQTQLMELLANGLQQQSAQAGAQAAPQADAAVPKAGTAEVQVTA